MEVHPLSARRPIKVLDENVARRIAAGEVIDRPASVLRELLDNSLDAGARSIDVRWENGGVEALQVTDDGWGMETTDLELCWLPHATSKIAAVEDLETLTSLGFRGEALASVAACARLNVLSSTQDSGLAYQLEIDNGRFFPVRKASGPRGTTVRVQGLFHDLPARRRFLKATSAESALCRRAFDEKVIAFPDVAFRLWIDGKLKVDLRAQTRGERLGELWGAPWNEPNALRELTGGARECRWSVWTLLPPHRRSDRRGIRVWANGRPLQEFAFVQAACYAFEGWLPGGAFPWACIFLEIDPSLVDFNIHPAKREARFRGAEALHRSLVQTVREGLQASVPAAPLFGASSKNDSNEVADPGIDLPWSAPAQGKSPVLRGRGRVSTPIVWDPIRPFAISADLQQSETTSARPTVYPFRYLGQVLGVFLIIEREESLFLVDQHAAHERLLFDELRSQSGRTQELLFPRRFPVEPEINRALEERQDEWRALGIGLTFVNADEVELTRLPQSVADRVDLVIEFLTDFVKTPKDLEKDLYATLSCRSAIMDGDPLDPKTACELVDRALRLENARCPHGRPLWTILTRKELFERVGRLV